MSTMRLGSDTGSVVNHLQSRIIVGAPEPTVGMGCTILHWTDRNPATIFRVIKVGKTTIVEVRNDDYQRTDSNGMSEEQDYAFKINVRGRRTHFRQAADGSWDRVVWNTESKRWKLSRGPGLLIGRRDCYHDFSF